ncbi:uncharacterized protein LOC118193267 [Stegodyphus dumicola]|uniref:uncharacterized protein LOC118193267 n=1 Tax=Stegodyphus dumicola TaxID=202533 RepID=UPI0015A8D6F8|nr:uncharacterized protein LOC118193267 [Stegodyphus dumicola]
MQLEYLFSKICYYAFLYIFSHSCGTKEDSSNGSSVTVTVSPSGSPDGSGVSISYSEIAHGKNTSSGCGTWPRPSSGAVAPTTLSPPSSSLEPSPTNTSQSICTLC